MRPTVRGLLDAEAELRQYKDHFVGVELDEIEKIDDVHLAATLTTADLQKMLPDAPLRHVLMLHRTFTSASRDGYAGVASASGTSSGKNTDIVLPVQVKLMVKSIVEDEEHAREGNLLLVRPAYYTAHTCSLCIPTSNYFNPSILLLYLCKSYPVFKIPRIYVNISFTQPTFIPAQSQVGTLIVQAPKWPSKDGEMAVRINNMPVTSKQMQLRRTVDVPGLGERRTCVVFTFSLPLIITLLYSVLL